jgi:hypothetical protein
MFPQYYRIFLQVPDFSSKHDDRDPDPSPPEDDELFDASDAESMEETINKFVDGLESQDRSGFDDIHRLIKYLPVPVTKAIRQMTHDQAIEAQFLPNMTEEEQKRFTRSELLLCKHAKSRIQVDIRTAEKVDCQCIGSKSGV